MTQVSSLRLKAMRLFYFLLFAERGYRAFPSLLGAREPLGALAGVAYSYWGALALLALLGLRYPLQMIPILLIFVLYKILWLLGVALPLWMAGTPFDPAMTAFTWAMAVGGVLGALIVPWGYVLTQYVRQPGERSTKP